MKTPSNTPNLDTKDIDFYTRCGFLCKKLSEIISHQFEEKLKPLDLTHRDCVILWLCLKDTYNQLELSRFLSADKIPTDKNQIRERIDTLETKGWIKRIQNPQNRRENQIILTQKGVSMALKTYDLMGDLHHEIFLSVLSKGEYDTLLKLLKKVVRAIESKGEII